MMCLTSGGACSSAVAAFSGIVGRTNCSSANTTTPATKSLMKVLMENPRREAAHKTVWSTQALFWLKWIWRCRHLARQQRDSARHQQHRNPSSPVHFFVQKDLRRERVPDERQRRGRRSHQANVSPRQRKQQSKKSHCHRHYTQKEIRVTEHSRNHAPEPRPAPNLMHIPHLLHR